MLAAPNRGWLGQHCARAQPFSVPNSGTRARLLVGATHFFASAPSAAAPPPQQQPHQPQHSSTSPTLPPAPFALTPARRYSCAYPPVFFRRSATLPHWSERPCVLGPFLHSSSLLALRSALPEPLPCLLCFVSLCVVVLQCVCGCVAWGARQLGPVLGLQQPRSQASRTITHTHSCTPTHTQRNSTHTQGRLRFAQPSS